MWTNILCKCEQIFITNVNKYSLRAWTNPDEFGSTRVERGRWSRQDFCPDWTLWQNPHHWTGEYDWSFWSWGCICLFLKKELDDEETMLLEGAPIYFQLCSTIEFQSLTWLFYILEAVIVWLSWYRYCKLFINHQFHLWKMFPRSLWMTICGTRLPSVAEETSLRPQLTMRTRAEVRLRMMARIMMTMKIFGANPHEHLFKCKEIQWQNKAYHPSWVEVALVI